MQFVGHNAFLRWKAIQSVAFEEDGQSKKRPQVAPYILTSAQLNSGPIGMSLKILISHCVFRSNTSL